MKRYISLAAWCLISLCMSAPVLAETDNAQSLSQAAFRQIETQPFDSDALLNAVNTLNQAALINLQEPWGYISSTYATLSSGYQGGNRYEKTSYLPDHLVQAEKLARKAIELGPDVSLSHVSLALVDIINGNLTRATQGLQTAHDIDPDNFYPYYYRGVIAVKQNQPAGAKSSFRGAMQRTTYTEHKIWVINQLQILAGIEQDTARLDELLREAIDIDPTSPTGYEAYGQFLIGQARQEEAVPYLEKAVQLTPRSPAEQTLLDLEKLAAN